VHWNNPTPVVAAIVEHPSGILLIRNRGWPEKFFGLVTGFLEAGETPEEGCLREVHEELGLRATTVRLIGVYPFVMLNQVILAWHVLSNGEVVLGDELEAFKAIPPDKLRPWDVGTGQAVRDWLAARATVTDPRS
jgi:ADP-ribose pyrophosphatase YjhB (NUDIX family)